MALKIHAKGKRNVLSNFQSSQYLLTYKNLWTMKVYYVVALKHMKQSSDFC